MILDESKDWEVVSYPYNIFFSHTESKHVEKLNWKSVRVFEKAEGILCVLYHYQGLLLCDFESHQRKMAPVFKIESRWD